MAENSKGNIVPDIPKNADKILFVEDLVECVMYINCPKYVLKEELASFREHVRSYFEPNTQIAVCHLEMTSVNKVHELFLLIQNETGLKNCVKSALIAAAAFIPDTKHFNARHFLKFCVTASRLAVEFYNRGNLKAPMLAKWYILKIFKKYDATTFRWDSFLKFTSLYANKLQVKRLEMNCSYDDLEFDSEIDSEIILDEVETLIATHDKVICEGLENLSLTEEQNSLSENGEKNLEIQQERSCLEIESAFSKSEQYFSETSSDKNLKKSENL